MDKLQITGKAILRGSISVSGSKNAALPIMIASLLSENGLYLKNLPSLQDILTMKKLLENFGIKIKKINSQTFFDSTNINNSLADYDLVRKMRASILVLGPLIARFKTAKISLPGGCAIGTRPIDIHLKGLEKLGGFGGVGGDALPTGANDLAPTEPQASADIPTPSPF